MIKIKRSRDAISLHKGFTGPGLLLKMDALAKAKIEQGDRIAWEGQIGDWGSTKPQLKTDSFDKCAYCESDTAVVAYGDVEHFRPKSVYWWLALCLDNYVYACQLCNQTHKRDRFPVIGPPLTAPPLPATFTTSDTDIGKFMRAACPDPALVDETALNILWSREGPHVPHPYLEDPEPLFAWAASEINREVELVAPDDATPRSRLAVAAVSDCLGLNRDTLKRTRYVIYAGLRTAVRAWKIHNDEESLHQIRFMCSPQHPYAGMCRYFSRLAGAPLTP